MAAVCSFDEAAEVAESDAPADGLADDVADALFRAVAVARPELPGEAFPAGAEDLPADEVAFPAADAFADGEAFVAEDEALDGDGVGDAEPLGEAGTVGDADAAAGEMLGSGLGAFSDGVGVAAAPGAAWPGLLPRRTRNSRMMINSTNNAPATTARRIQ